MEEIIYVPVDILRRFTYQVFVGLGVPEEDAEICSEVLLASDLRGIESHGVGRLKRYYDRIRQGILSPVTRFEIVKDTPTTAVVDGHHGMGHVIGYRSMRLAMDKAREYGLGTVAVRNSSHFGIAGYYALMTAKEGMIGLYFTNALTHAVELSKLPQVEVYVVGGYLRGVSYAMVGRLARQALDGVYFDLAFLGANGVSLEHGVTIPALEEAETAAEVVRHARKTVLVVDHTKFGVVTHGNIADLADVDAIVTDWPLVPSFSRALEELDVEVHLAEGGD